MTTKGTLNQCVKQIWCEVLGVDELSENDTFFELGGNSLAAVRILHQLNGLLGIECSLRTFFEYDTVSSFASVIRKQLNLRKIPEKNNVENYSRKQTVFPLTPAQKQMYFFYFSDFPNANSASAYHVPLVLKLEGDLKVTCLEKSINVVINRHAVFRFLFQEDHHRIVQRLGAYPEIKLVEEKISQKKLNHCLQEIINQKFKLHRAPLVRCNWLKISEKLSYLVFVFPHILMDAWSLQIFKKELIEHYKGFIEHNPRRLSKPASYTQYLLEGQKESPKIEQRTKKALRFWKNKLAHCQEITLPHDYKRPNKKSYRGERHKTFLSMAMFEQVRVFGQKNNTSAFTVLFAVLVVLLYRYNLQEDVVIGFPVSGRDATPFDDTIGLFIRTLILRITLNEDEIFENLLKKVKAELLEAYTYQQVSFDQLVKYLRVPRHENKNPIFQVMMVWQDYFDLDEVELTHLKIVPKAIDNHTSKFDVTFEFIRVNDELQLTIEYDTDLYSKNTIRQLSDNFHHILFSLLKYPDMPLTQLTCCVEDKAEKTQSNDKPAPVNGAVTIHSLFETQVEKQGQRIALRFNNQTLTYGELNQKANRLAHHIIKYLSSQNDSASSKKLIGVCLDRSLDLVITLLAILKTGSAYVPLDPAWPKERLNYVIEDTSCELIISENSFKAKFLDYLKILWLTDAKEIAWDANKNQNPNMSVSNEMPMYVIYTSGTTGVPKGVVQTHKNVATLLATTQPLFHFTEQDVWTLFHSYAFDFSVWEMWGALTSGGTLVIPSFQETRDPILFRQLLSNQKVTVLNQTPSAFQLFLQDDTNRSDQPLALRYIIFGGEAFEYYLLKQWLKKHAHEDTALINMYGITEITVHATFKKLNETDLVKNDVRSNMGYVLPHLQPYVVDKNLNVVPSGMPGELLLGGVGISPGYLNRPELTAEKFIQNKFEQEGENAKNAKNTRLYRTGDVVRQLADGSFEYWGRVDQQLKVKGVRIEPREIELVLLAYPGIRHCVVTTVNKNHRKTLCAYYVMDNHAAHTTSEMLHQYVLSKLPEYMAPTVYLKINKMPLNQNMKIDYGALPAPDKMIPLKTRAISSRVCSKAEEYLMNIWKKILHVESINPHSNFFNLGGDSMTSVLVVVAAKKQGFNFTVSDVFRLQTIAKLAKFYLPTLGLRNKREAVLKLNPAIKNKVSSGDIVATYPLSALQWGMVYHSMQEPNSSMYLDVFSYRINGQYHYDIFLSALQSLLSKHPVLRTSYQIQAGASPMQVVHQRIDLPFEQETIPLLSASEQSQKIAQWCEAQKKRPFNYAEAPLFRIKLFVLNDRSFAFCLAFHHSILDGWSVASFVSQVLFACDQLQRGKQLNSSVDTNFKTFIALEQESISNAESKQFWARHLEGYEPTKFMSEDFLNQSPVLASSHVVLAKARTQQLMAIAQGLDISLDEILLAACFKVLQCYSNQDEVVLGVVFNGRPSVEGIENTLGLFLNTLPIRLNLKKKSWKELIIEISNQKKSVYPHRRYPFSQITTDCGTNDLLDCIFYFTNFHVYDAIKTNGYEIKNQHVYEMTNFPMAFNVQVNPLSKQLEIIVNYHANKFDKQKIECVLECYDEILRHIETQIDRSHDLFSGFDISKQYYFLTYWNCTEIHLRKNKPVPVLFEEMVQKFPKKIGLISDNGQWNYAEIAQAVEKIAQYFLQKKWDQRKPIGVCAEREAITIISILAIFKAGYIYLPIDPAYPPERINYIVRDAGCELVLTQTSLNAKIQCSGIEKIVLDNKPVFDDLTPVNVPVPKITLDTPAYLIYTSGSTGNPKGVLVTHRSLTNLLLDIKQKIQFTSQDVMLALTSFAFDISLLEIMLPLVSGSRCVITHQAGSKDPRWINHAIKYHGITTIQATPTTWHMLLEYGIETTEKKEIKVLCGGESMPPHLVEKLLRLTSYVWNVYGPTETTIWSTLHNVTRRDSGLPRVPIGKPLANTKIYILDEQLKPVPVGGVGTLYIAGLGVAAGYHNQPKLTDEKFISNPFDADNKLFSRLYNTGDLARWLPDGSLDCLGRSDFQVKVRGFRIETAEIETILQQHPAIKTCTVVLKEKESEKYLVAFLVRDATRIISVKALRQFLLEKLPYYYLPDHYVFIDRIPLTYNEKIDRKKLLSITPNARTITQAEPVFSTGQTRLANLWKNLLAIHTVSLTDDFFDLGGNSLLTLRLVKAIEDEFDISMTIKEVIENANFSDMFSMVSKTSEKIKFPSSEKDQTHKKLMDTVITLLKGRGESALFLIHPIGGNVFYYLPFVRLLKKTRMVYGIQDPGLVDHTISFSSLHEMAAFYIEMIKQYQPIGPYFLAGSSFGANLAVEIARQLKDAGEKILFVGLLDGWARYPKQATENRVWFEKNLTHQLETMYHYFCKEELPELFFDLHWHRQQLLVKHKLPDMSDIKLTLFKAEMTMPVLLPIEGKYNNWDFFCKTVPDLYRVPGDHFTMHFPPHHRALAKIFQLCLEHATRDAETLLATVLS